MKYIEEISPGDLFIVNNARYILSCDYKIVSKNKIEKMAISIQDWSVKWFGASEIVDIVDLYYRDDDGNILLVKEYKDGYSNAHNFL